MSAACVSGVGARGSALPFAPKLPTALWVPRTEAPQRHQRSTVLLGMPMLNADGLSEAWLQKTCGELHWQALSRALGRPPEQWQDRGGRRVYAAFCGIELQGARLEAAAEGQRLLIDSELRWLGASQAWSQHRVHIGGRTLGLLDMVSAFVSRHRPDCNASVRRAEMPDGAADAPQAAATSRCATLRKQRQALLADRAMGEGDGLRHGTVTPCPRQDFNGAGLLYFPSFTALADRALWQWGLWGRDEVLRHRECIYTGNVDGGEPVRVSLKSDTPSDRGGRTLCVVLSSARDARCLAAVRLVLGSAA